LNVDGLEKNANQMQCFGFRFTLPRDFTIPNPNTTPNPSLFVPYTTNTYFTKGNVTFTNNKMTLKSGAACDYRGTLPLQP
jgi:hypothetical protein